MAFNAFKVVEEASYLRGFIPRRPSPGEYQTLPRPGNTDQISLHLNVRKSQSAMMCWNKPRSGSTCMQLATCSSPRRYRSKGNGRFSSSLIASLSNADEAHHSHACDTRHAVPILRASPKGCRAASCSNEIGTDLMLHSAGKP